MLLEHPVRTAQ